MPEKFARIRRAICEYPWAVHPAFLDIIVEVVEMRAAGGRFTAEEIEERISAAERPRQAATSPGNVAVLPLHGLISHRIYMVDDISGDGGTSTERFTRDFQRAMSDTNVGAVVLDVDSPGGSVHGVEELGDVIFSARGQKPVVAVANAWAASAAYWLASQADELVVTPSGEVGSIGVIAAHDDLSARAEQMGIKRTFVTAGRFKAEGNEFEPLADEARDYLQQRVNDYYAAFTKAVARGRGVKQSVVESERFGEGRMVGAQAAVAAGMADRVGTLQGEIDRLVKRQNSRRQARARVALAAAGRRTA